MRNVCRDGDYAGLSLEGIVGRWRYACRSFGGPQGAVWETSNESRRACLLAAHEAGATFMADRLASLNACLADDSCEASDIDPNGERRAAAVEEIEQSCQRPALEAIDAPDAPTFADHAAQQYLVLSNQKDETQQRDAFFDSEPLFINTMREQYCATKDLPGIHWYLTTVSSESVHVVTLRPERWEDEVGGIAMSDWLADAIDRPDEVDDRAEEGDFTAVIPGVEPFPCAVSP